jgi:hypothetical protein
MFGLILLGILTATLLIGGLLFLMFADAAAGEPRPLHNRALPLLTGEALKDWARDRSRTMTIKWLALHPDRRQPDGLARRIEADAGQVLEQAIFRESPADRGLQRCQESLSVPQVTAPEAFAIADEIRKLPQSIWLPVAKHVAAAAKNNSGGCPLMTPRGMCLCAIARPLGCRGRCLAGFDSSDEAAAWAATLEEGLSEGMQQELSSAGLDSNRYDLNHALAAILPEPALETDWRRGKPLLPT